MDKLPLLYPAGHCPFEYRAGFAAYGFAPAGDKKVLEYDELEKIVDFLARAEKKADEKIAALEYSRSKIRAAKASYEQKLRQREGFNGVFVKYCPKRVILLSDTLEKPSLDNLWNYLCHFYEKVPPALKPQFDFEDLAGVYTANGLSRLFAVCTRYAETDGLKVLPEGKYLCVDCTGEDREQALEETIRTAQTQYGIEPAFTVQLITVTGILSWAYQIQIPLFEN